ncbi:unnamed protein product [Pedinophyceae sp. YPF-701]|nr:unnamed protein product [Pedinophyceae sp. YPF-701]
MKAADKLSEIAEIADQKERTSAYARFLTELISNVDGDGIRDLIEHILSDAVPLVVSRQIMLQLAEGLRHLTPDLHKRFAEYCLEQVQARAISFEESAATIRENLSALHEQERSWSKAAQVLAGIDLESGTRVLDHEYKLGRYVRIALLYLEDGDTTSAESYIKRASPLLGHCKDKNLEIKYKTCYARVLDSKRRFLEAATRYCELSQTSGVVEDHDPVAALAAAVTCTILAPAGPQRSRLLATLFKDERCQSLPSFTILEKVFFERILSRAEVDTFAATLKTDQTSRTPDGTSVLDQAVLEHNVQACSKLYANISSNQLGSILGVEASRAEEIVGGMISEGRLSGHIDQVGGAVVFTDLDSRKAYIQHVEGACNALNRIVEMLHVQ